MNVYPFDLDFSEFDRILWKRSDRVKFKQFGYDESKDGKDEPLYKYSDYFDEWEKDLDRRMRK
jgi:hypothetical protein